MDSNGDKQGLCPMVKSAGSYWFWKPRSSDDIRCLHVISCNTFHDCIHMQINYQLSFLYLFKSVTLWTQAKTKNISMWISDLCSWLAAEERVGSWKILYNERMLRLGRSCSCGRCHFQWFRNGWICPGPVREVTNPWELAWIDSDPDSEISESPVSRTSTSNNNRFGYHPTGYHDYHASPNGSWYQPDDPWVDPVQDPWNVPNAPGRSSNWDPWNAPDPWANGSDPWANDANAWQRRQDVWDDWDAWLVWEVGLRKLNYLFKGVSQPKKHEKLSWRRQLTVGRAGSNFVSFSFFHVESVSGLVSL